MTAMQNQALEVLPNVLHDQTVPNTLGGLAAPGPVGRLRLPPGVLVAAGAIVLALLAILLGRPA